MVSAVISLPALSILLLRLNSTSHELLGRFPLFVGQSWVSFAPLTDQTPLYLFHKQLLLDYNFSNRKMTSESLPTHHYNSCFQRKTSSVLNLHWLSLGNYLNKDYLWLT